MNKSELIARMAERLDGDRTTAVTAVNGVLEEIEGSVARGERVSLTGFGTFERRERAARTARNPRTGETIQVHASVVPAFRAGTGFRTRLTEAPGGAGSADASSTSVDGIREVAATPDVDTHKGGKKARKQAAEKSAAAKGKAGKGKDKEKRGKKAAKDVRNA